MATQKESVFEGKTLDDAVRMGLDALGLSRAEVMIKVIEEGSGGFLGLGARPYRVQVMPRPGGPPREPAERGARGPRGRGGRDRRGRRGEREEGRGETRRGGRREDRGGERDRGREPGEPARQAGSRREARAGGRQDGGRGRPRHAEAATQEPVAEGADSRGRRRRRGRRGGRGRRGEQAPAAPPLEVVGTMPADEAPLGGEPGESRPSEHRPAREPRDRSRGAERGQPAAPRPGVPALSAAELEERAVGAARDLFRAMGFEATVTAHAEGENVDLTAQVPEGEELLTGRKGEVRQALQHLLNLTVNRGEGMRYHVQLEINEFWHQREAELQALARSMADDAVARGDEVLTEYLNAQERRVIHVALRDDTRVQTYAIGDGLIKKLAVAPADRAEREEDARDEG